MPYPPHAVKAGRSKALQRDRETHLWTELLHVPGSRIGQDWLTRPSTMQERPKTPNTGCGYGPIRISKSDMRKTPEGTNPAMTLPELTGQSFEIPGTIRTDFLDPDLTGGIPTDLSPSWQFVWDAPDQEISSDRS